MNELKTFYSNLYSEKTTNNTKNWIKELKQSDLIPQLTPEKNENLKKDIKIEQFENIMKKCSKNKSPGNDGLTQEFYEYFWNEICHTFYESYIESKNTKKLTTSQRQNIICLLGKSGKR